MPRKVTKEYHSNHSCFPLGICDHHPSFLLSTHSPTLLTSVKDTPTNPPLNIQSVKNSTSPTCPSCQPSWHRPKCYICAIPRHLERNVCIGICLTCSTKVAVSCNCRLRTVSLSEPCAGAEQNRALWGFMPWGWAPWHLWSTQLESSLWLEQSASATRASTSEQRRESPAPSLSLSAGMFILSLFPSRLFLLMTHNIQIACSLVKWIQVMELHEEVFLVKKID